MNGGSPLEINADIFPSNPLPHEVLYNAKSKGLLEPTFTCVVWTHPPPSVTVIVCWPEFTFENVTADNVVFEKIWTPSIEYVYGCTPPTDFITNIEPLFWLQVVPVVLVDMVKVSVANNVTSSIYEQDDESWTATE